MDIFGEDYPTRDGTCVRDYIQVTDLIDAHLAALAYLRAGGDSLTCNCGYGHGATVKEVIEVVKRVSGVDFKVNHAPRRAGDPAAIVAKAERVRERSAGGRSATISTRSSARRSTGSGACTTASGRPTRPEPPPPACPSPAADGRALQAPPRRALTRQTGKSGRNACGGAVGGDERGRHPCHRTPRQVLWRLRGGQRRQSQGQARLDPRADRPERRRQDDLLQYADQVPRAELRPHPVQRPRHHRDAAGRRRPPRPRALVPDFGGLPAPDGARERARRAAAPSRRQLRLLALEEGADAAQRARDGAARPGRPRRLGRLRRGRNLLWPQARAGDRHHAGARPRDAAARRADGGHGPRGHRPHRRADPARLGQPHHPDGRAQSAGRRRPLRPHHRADARPGACRGRLQTVSANQQVRQAYMGVGYGYG